MDHGVEHRPAADLDGGGVDLDVADRAVGHAVPEGEALLPARARRRQLGADLLSRERVELVEALGAQLVAAPAVP